MKRQVAFEPAKIGVDYEGRRITTVRSDSQAERLGVQVGWMIKSVNGAEMTDDAKTIQQAIMIALPSHSLHSYGPGMYGLCSYGLRSHGLYSAVMAYVVMAYIERDPSGHHPI